MVVQTSWSVPGFHASGFEDPLDVFFLVVVVTAVHTVENSHPSLLRHDGRCGDLAVRLKNYKLRICGGNDAESYPQLDPQTILKRSPQPLRCLCRVEATCLPGGRARPRNDGGSVETPWPSPRWSSPARDERRRRDHVASSRWSSPRGTSGDAETTLAASVPEVSTFPRWRSGSTIQGWDGLDHQERRDPGEISSA